MQSAEKKQILDKDIVRKYNWVFAKNYKFVLSNGNWVLEIELVHFELQKKLIFKILQQGLHFILIMET